MPSQMASISRRSFLVGRPAPREESFVRGAELVQLALRRKVLREFRDLLCPHALFGDLKDLEGIEGDTLPDGNGVSDLDGFGGLGGSAVQLHFVAVAGFGGVTPRLVQADGPYVLVNPY